MHKQLKGVVVPIVTLYDRNGHVDLQGMRELVAYLIEHGVSGLFPCGTTGEGPLLTPDERRAIAETVVDAAAGRATVIVHAGAITTGETCALTDHARSIGADGAALIAPYYYPLSDEALFRHFVTVAEREPDFPLYLYNIPNLTGNALSVDLVRRLVETCPNIVGVKDSSGSLDYLMHLLQVDGRPFATANGSDAHILAAVAMGCSACVSGNANVVPWLVVALFKAAEKGDLERARVLQHRLNRVRDVLDDGANLSLFKGMLAMQGIAARADVRAPLLPIPPEVIQQRWATLQRVLAEDA